jgi:hypothetical protein
VRGIVSGLLLPVVTALAVLPALGCTDNATKLSFAIERATRGATPETNQPQRIVYTPETSSDRLYYLIFFPDHETGLADLVSAGLPEPTAIGVLRELAYLSSAPFLVVVQDDSRTTFTTHWRRFAHVPEILVVSAVGPVELMLRETGHGTVVEPPEAHH